MVVCLCGCAMDSPGTESAARKYFDAEFQKWIAGEKNDVSTMESRIKVLKEPISYDIRSIVKSDPEMMAAQDVANRPKDWESWPAYKVNVNIEWKSKGGAPVKSVASYNLTWNTTEKRWYVNELRY